MFLSVCVSELGKDASLGTYQDALRQRDVNIFQICDRDGGEPARRSGAKKDVNGGRRRMKRRFPRRLEVAACFTLHRLSSNDAEGSVVGRVDLGPVAAQETWSLEQLRVDERVGGERRRGRNVGRHERKTKEGEESICKLVLRVGQLEIEQERADIVKEDDSVRGIA